MHGVLSWWDRLDETTQLALVEVVMSDDVSAPVPVPVPVLEHISHPWLTPPNIMLAIVTTCVVLNTWKILTCR